MKVAPVEENKRGREVIKAGKEDRSEGQLRGLQTKETTVSN